MDIEEEIANLKTRVSAFRAMEKHQDLAIEAEAFFALSHKLEAQKRSFNSAYIMTVYQAANKHLIDQCMHLLTALWNEMPAKGSYIDIVEKWEEKICHCRRNFEYAKALYTFVLETIGISKPR